MGEAGQIAAVDGSGGGEEEAGCSGLKGELEGAAGSFEDGLG